MPNEPLRAVCDPLLLLNLILADSQLNTSYGKDFRLTTDPLALKSWLLASLLFDQFLGQPLLILGLESVLGPNYLDKIGKVIEKLHDAGLVNFDTEKYIPDEKKPMVDSVVRFLGDVEEAEKKVDELAGRTVNHFSPPYAMITFSRAANLPLFTTNEALQMPILGSTATAEPRINLLSHVLELELPVVEVQTLDELLDIRRSYGASEFRKVFNGFYQSIAPELARPDIAKTVYRHWAKIKNDALDLLVREFGKEITTWQTVKAGGSIALDVAGFFPGVSLVTGSISALKSTKELIDQRAKVQRAKDFAWLCFLTDLRSRPHA